MSNRTVSHPRSWPASFSFCFPQWTCGSCDGAEFDVFPSDGIIQRADVEFLASDETNGRDNDTPGSLLAQEYLMDQLVAMGAVGLNTAAVVGSRDAFRQEFSFPDGSSSGTNIIGMIPGDGST